MFVIDDIIKPEKLTEGNYMIMSSSGLMITMVKNDSGYKPVLAEYIEKNDDISQLFKFKKKRFEKKEDAWEISLFEDNNYCLDICWCSCEEGAPLIAYPRNNSAAQRFEIVKDKDGYRLLTAASGYQKYLAVAKDGRTLIQSSDKDKGSLWSIC